MFSRVIPVLLLAVLLCSVLGCRHRVPVRPGEPERRPFPVPAIDWSPRFYSAPRVSTPPVIDGKLDDAAWQGAAWTEEFVDIQGKVAPRQPWFSTRAKLAWDDEALYVAATMEEPHIWATYTERDSIIYHENDIELFLDPDGDTHGYHEIEINALNTVWDLYLVRPYRDGAPALHGYDWAGLKTAVSLDGTINDPSDVDRSWSVEFSVPWKALEGDRVEMPPLPGDRWRMNFSRVHWHLERGGDHYVKVMNPETGKPRAEENWTWTPQGLIAMHYPEMWGILEFAAGPRSETPGPLTLREKAGWQLMQVYYAQRHYQVEHGRWATRASALDLPDDLELEGWSWPPRVEATGHGFTAWMVGPDGKVLRVDQEGRLKEPRPEK